MVPTVLGRKEYLDKVTACYLGKSIGGTLGAPWECLRHTHDLAFYTPVPEKPAPNDDLDLQLIWLDMLEKEGLNPSVRTFAEWWARYASAYPWNEYGFFMRNYDRGLRPPVAGCFENYYVDEMGSPIRSEIWACLHPADPQQAALMAWKDSCLDHAGGEGMYGEMFWAAVESAAFVEQDPLTLVSIGLSMIPLASHVARSIREAVWCWQHGKTWGEARERIASRFGHIQPCNAVPNHGFIIIGWLYGKTFGEKLCKAVNCGYDTDCTGATLGSLLGILGGTDAIPQEWVRPVGRAIALHPFTRVPNPPRTVDELARRVACLAEKAAAGKPGVSFGTRTSVLADTKSRLFCAGDALSALRQDTSAGVELLNGEEVWLHYLGEPVIRPGIAKEVEVSFPSGDGTQIDLAVPAGWRCERVGPSRFRILARDPRRVAGRNRLTVTCGRGRVSFTILGPQEAQGFPAGENVSYCPVCRGRVGSCLCRKKGRRG